MTYIMVNAMEALQPLFDSYAKNFLIDTKFIQDGLTLLSRVIDFDASTRELIVFHEDFLQSPIP